MRAVPSSAGFSLIEVLIAAGLLVTGTVTLAHLFILAIQSNVAAREMSAAALAASAKLEELRALTWSFDGTGGTRSDLAADPGADPIRPDGGTGLTPGSRRTLEQNTPGYVDYVDARGRKLGGGAMPPADAAYARRWSIEPLAADPQHSLVLRVLVMRAAVSTTALARVRPPGAVHLAVVRTRSRR